MNSNKVKPDANDVERAKAVEKAVKAWPLFTQSQLEQLAVLLPAVEPGSGNSRRAVRAARSPSKVRTLRPVSGGAG